MVIWETLKISIKNNITYSQDNYAIVNVTHIRLNNEVFSQQLFNSLFYLNAYHDQDLNKMDALVWYYFNCCGRQPVSSAFYNHRSCNTMLLCKLYNSVTHVSQSDLPVITIPNQLYLICKSNNQTAYNLHLLLLVQTQIVSSQTSKKCVISNRVAIIEYTKSFQGNIYWSRNCL